MSTAGLDLDLLLSLDARLRRRSVTAPRSSGPEPARTVGVAGPAA